jgi:hypothetical protein
MSELLSSVKGRHVADSERLFCSRPARCLCHGFQTYEVAHRTRGLGVRQTLGATSRGIKVVVLRQGRTTAAVGLRVGVVSALGIQRHVSSLLYQRGALEANGRSAQRAALDPAPVLSCYLANEVRSMMWVNELDPLKSTTWRWWPRFSPNGTHCPAGCAKSKCSREPRRAVC